MNELIKWMPKTFSVLDVGCGGLSGENTSVNLVNHFGQGNVTGICKESRWNWKDVAEFKSNFPNVKHINDDFYSHKFDTLFDLVVLDLNIENNILNDWSDDGLQKMRSLVAPKGYLINYIMTTTEYGDPNETPKLLADHRDRWWGSFESIDIGRRLNSLPGWKFIAHQREERRPYITWVLLQNE